jgi:hypothetical protein
MENMPNRKQRRQMAKDAGFLKMKKSLSFEKQIEMSRRASEFGKQIHLSNVEQNLRNEENRLRELEKTSLEYLVSKGNTYEEALEIIQGKNEADRV